MCRIEERVYIGADGHRSKFEDTFPCKNASRGKLCSQVQKRTSEYHPKKGSLARDDTPSPPHPPTPTGAGTYLVQQRRPSGSGSRPSTREGVKQVPAEIHINIGGSKKDRTKKYPLISVTSKPSHKRASHGSMGSGDLILDSPDSDTSPTLRTGFPDAPLPHSTAYERPESYIPTPTMSNHHRHTGSSGSSRTPSLYVTSDPDRDYDWDSPVSHRPAKYPTTVVHNPPAMPPPSPSREKKGYRTSIIAPKYSEDSYAPEGLYPLDYADLADRSGSSHASSAGPENPRKGKESRRKKDEERAARQVEMDRLVAEELDRADNVKQVRFELGRADMRAKERAENTLAEKEKLKAETREEARRQRQLKEEKDRREKMEREARAIKEQEREARAIKEQEREARAVREKDREAKAIREQEREARAIKEQQDKQDREARAVKTGKKRDSKPPISYREPRPTTTRRNSMTQAQIEEQARLIAAEQSYTESERKLADARDQQEQTALVKQKQESSSYYDPRGGDRSLSGANNTSLVRRGSVSRGNSSSTVSTVGALTRTGSHRRASIVQGSAPVLPPQPQPNYSTRPPSARQHNPPPVSFPSKFNQGYDRPPSARRPSYTADPPSSASLTRGSGSSLDNPFSPNVSASSSSVVSHDPWDLRNVESAVPRDDRYAAHNRAQQATRAIGHASSGYSNVFDDDSDSPDAYPTRTSGRKKR